MANRRVLGFGELNDIVHDVALLQLRGYDAVGKWNLAQTCAHVADWISFPIDGYPPAPWHIAPLLWSIKVTVGPSQLKKILQRGSMPAGGPTMPQTIHPPETPESIAVDRLIATIRRLEAYRGALQPSPVFGKVERDQMQRLQLIHAAHHFSFLVPRHAT